MKKKIRMKMTDRGNRLLSAALPLLIGVGTVAIFVADTLADLEIAVAAFYVIIVLLAAFRFGIGGIVAVSAICCALTVLSFFLTWRDDLDASLVNGVIGLLTIVATAYLTVRIKQAETAMLDARAKLAHASRLTVLGQLSASIAHEVNQPLAAIVTNSGAGARWLATEPPNFEEVRQALARVTRDANRASQIVARVRSMASAARTQQWLSVNEVIRQVTGLLNADFLAHHIWITLRLADDLPSVLADRIQLQQVLVNLVQNAIEAMQDAPGRHAIFITSRREGDALVTIEVRDTGKGIGAGDAERIFEAFYTTKTDGMGMGLAISRSILEAYGGTIAATPDGSRGTIFRLTLPATLPSSALSEVPR